MKVLPLLVLALTVGTGASHSDRVEGLRAVERARYAFALNATRPFDEVYPREVFEKRVCRQEQEERVLRERFRLAVTPALLAREYERIERETRAPEQWAAIRRALGDDRRRLEEIFCRPLLVERALHARFDFDPRVHAEAHARARRARAAFLSGRTPVGAASVRILRKPDAAPTTDELLERSRAEPSGPRSPDSTQAPPPLDSPFAVNPEMARVLEKELRRPGDVTTILEERDRFSVFRLQGLDGAEWRVLAVQIPKRDFEGWFESLRRR